MCLSRICYRITYFLHSKTTRLTRGARPALGQVFRAGRGYGALLTDCEVTTDSTSRVCYYDDATVRDSKVWTPEVAPIVELQVLGQ